MIDHSLVDDESCKDLTDLVLTERLLADIYADSAAIAPSIPWPSSDMSPEWAAGFVDGEGHFGINKHVRKVNGRPQYLTRSQIGNTEKYLLEPFLVFGGLLTKIEASRWNPNAAACYKWTIHNREAQNFTLAILPHLKNKRKIESAKINLRLEFLRKRAGGNKIDDIRVEQQEFYYQEILKVNKRGPVLEEVRYDPPSDHMSEFTRLEQEYAGVIARVLDYAFSRQLRLPEAILAKMAFNANRPYRHGGKAF